MSGYFGTPCARRHSQTPDPDVMLPPPNTAECARCETVVILAGKALPKGWVLVEDGAICPDCDEATSRQARRIDLAAVREILRSREAEPIGELADGRPHHGCRISHEIVCGFAALEVRGGAVAPEGRDEAVPFMLDGPALDQLIIHLSTIRAELNASQPIRAGGGNA